MPEPAKLTCSIPKTDAAQPRNSDATKHIMKNTGTGQKKKVSMKFALGQDQPCAGPSQKQPFTCSATTPKAETTLSTSM